MARWFGRFPTGTESREDTYLLDPILHGLWVKIRAGGALEVKAYRGSAGILKVEGRACGLMEAWQKRSFPFSPLSQDGGDPAGSRPMRRRRRTQISAAGRGYLQRLEAGRATRSLRWRLVAIAPASRTAAARSRWAVRNRVTGTETVREPAG